MTDLVMFTLTAMINFIGICMHREFSKDGGHSDY